MRSEGMAEGPGGVDRVPKPVAAGPEMAELLRFHPDVAWTGVIEENGMGPGTPRMLAVGRGRHRDVQDGLWIVGDYEQEQFTEAGSFVLKWQLHWVAGWDPSSGEYRSLHADNYGHTGVMRGHIVGDRLTFRKPRRPTGQDPADLGRVGCS